MSNASFLGYAVGPTSTLPLFSSRVSAGFPSPAADHLEERISLDELLEINAPQTFLARAHGDSMTGAGIFDDDVLVVNRAITPSNGSIVIACLNAEVFVKRLVKVGGEVILQAENDRYPPRYLMEADELLIWGVVTDSIRHHRHD